MPIVGPAVNLLVDVHNVTPNFLIVARAITPRPLNTPAMDRTVTPLSA